MPRSELDEIVASVVVVGKEAKAEPLIALPDAQSLTSPTRVFSTTPARRLRHVTTVLSSEFSSSTSRVELGKKGERWR